MYGSETIFKTTSVSTLNRQNGVLSSVAEVTESSLMNINMKSISSAPRKSNLSQDSIKSSAPLEH